MTSLAQIFYKILHKFLKLSFQKAKNILKIYTKLFYLTSFCLTSIEIGSQGEIHNMIELLKDDKKQIKDQCGQHEVVSLKTTNFSVNVGINA